MPAGWSLWARKKAGRFEVRGEALLDAGDRPYRSGVLPRAHERHAIRRHELAVGIEPHVSERRLETGPREARAKPPLVTRQI